jgi:hypothetical protein
MVSCAQAQRRLKDGERFDEENDMKYVQVESEVKL